VANSFYGAVALTGGGTGALDDINHNNLSDGDGAIVIDAVNDISYLYTYNSSSSDSENSPNVIVPDSNSGDGRWTLVKIGSGLYVEILSSYSTFAAAITSIGSTETELWITKDDSMTGNVTVPQNVHLKFLDGYTIDPNGNTLTIFSPDNIIASRFKCFEESVTFSYGTGVILPEWFGTNTTPGTTNMATAIQADIDSAETIGTATQLGVGATISFSGRYSVESALTINHDGIYLVGDGKNNTRIINAGTDINTIYFGAADPTTDLVYGGGVKDMTLSYTGNDPADGAHIYADRTARQEFDNLHLRDHYRGIVFAGNGENCRLTNSDIEQGGNMTGAVQAGAYGIFIVAREVDSGEPNAIEDPDDAGTYYEEPNSIYISNCNIKTVVDENGFEYALAAFAFDGLYLTNNRFGSGDVGAILIYPQFGAVPLTNLVASGNFIDQSAEQNALYGIRYLNHTVTTPYVYKHVWSGTDINNHDYYGVLMQGDWDNVVFDGGSVRGSGRHGMFIQDGENFSVSNFQFRWNNKEDSTYQHLNITDVDGGNVTGCTFDGNNGAGDTATTYRGVQLTGTTKEFIINGCQFKNHQDTSVHSSIWMASAGVTSNKVYSCTSDNSISVASAAAMELPLEHDVIYVTGTTNITSIDADDETNGYSGFDGKVVTLIFEGVLTFTDGSNLKLNNNFSTSANDTITLVYYGENWYEVSRSAN